MVITIEGAGKAGTYTDGGPGMIAQIGEPGQLFLEIIRKETYDAS